MENEQTELEQNGINEVDEQSAKQIGLTGFIFSLIAVFILFIPIFGLLLSITALIISWNSVTKRPKGFAIAGFIISIIDVIMSLFTTWMVFQIGNHMM